MTRKNITYNQPLEKEIGFSRAVRIGNIIAVSATAPIAKDGSVHTPGDLYGQTKRCLEIIKDVIEQAGGHLDDVIRTRLFIKDMKRWKEAAKAHGEYFSNIQPVCGFIGASDFINPEWLIEVEVDCVLQK
jgi:enamine deaminase RidA (YjgF/YER057c/UK114 family)